jgi:hypothetical protein
MPAQTRERKRWADYAFVHTEDVKIDSDHRAGILPVAKRSMQRSILAGSVKLAEYFPHQAAAVAAIGGEARCHILAPKKPRLAARKIAPTCCRQFAARLVGGVNVRPRRKSQVERKCITQCRISCQTTRHLGRASF